MNGFDTDRFRDLTERFIFQGGSEYGIALADELDRLRAENKLYAAEMSAAREAGFETAQDVYTSYVGVTEQLHEQARLLGISAENELALLAKVERLERELENTARLIQYAMEEGKRQRSREIAGLLELKGK